MRLSCEPVILQRILTCHVFVKPRFEDLVESLKCLADLKFYRSIIFEAISMSI